VSTLLLYRRSRFKLGPFEIFNDSNWSQTQDSGFNLTQQDIVQYFKWLASSAAANGLKIGLKNALGLIPDLSSVVHFAINEQCVQYNECGGYKPIIAAGKPVFQIEYPGTLVSSLDTSSLKDCSNPGIKGLSVLLKKRNLNGWVMYCGDPLLYNTATAPGSNAYLISLPNKKRTTGRTARSRP
jgi:hypothetical protein